MSKDTRALTARQVERRVEQLDLGLHSTSNARRFYDARMQFCRSHLVELDNQLAALAAERAALVKEMEEAPAKLREAEQRERKFAREIKAVKAQPILSRIEELKSKLRAMGVEVPV